LAEGLFFNKSESVENGIVFRGARVPVGCAVRRSAKAGGVVNRAAVSECPPQVVGLTDFYLKMAKSVRATVFDFDVGIQADVVDVEVVSPEGVNDFAGSVVVQIFAPFVECKFNVCAAAANVYFFFRLHCFLMFKIFGYDCIACINFLFHFNC
jgi:hypothetical protein